MSVSSSLDLLPVSGTLTCFLLRAMCAWATSYINSPAILHPRKRRTRAPVFISPEATNTGPGFNRGPGGSARGCGFEERVGAYARTHGGRFL